MPKRTLPSKGPEIRLNASLPVPLYKQLYERLRGAILAGQLERGTRLPSTRTLADELGVSRNTTALAYEQLLLEGYLESQVGFGTVVSRNLPATLLHDHAERSQPRGKDAQEKEPARLASHVRSLQEILYTDRIAGGIGVPFRGGEPALDLFPYNLWARLIARRARQSLSDLGYYQSRAGYQPLREAIAAHIGITRGVRCTPEQIILTAGSQGAIDLALRTLLDPDDAVWIENPGYSGAQGALVAARARLVPVPVDEQGIDVEIGRQRCPDARMVFTTPSHQFPTGVTMSLSRRLALLEYAEQSGMWILEDDYDSEYRFSGRPLEALYGLDQAGRVIYIGTFSKTLFPTLRLGYLVAPLELIDPLLAMRRVIDVHVPYMEQMALTDFLEEGHFARHLRHMLQHYTQRRNLLHQELTTHLSDLLEVYVPEAGMHLVGWLPPDKDDRYASDLAFHVGIEAAPISKYSLEPLPRGGLLFGYAGTNEETIRREVKKLAAALKEL
jgi:GntR family transcriptional regulator / MocR family aminotransferase